MTSEGSPPAGPPKPEQEAMLEELLLAFAPLDKRALGLAVGITVGTGVFALTAFHVIASPSNAIDISLLAQYMYGYTVSWKGALVGSFWGFFSGFVAGWFTAFCRNMLIAMWIFVGRTKAELTATRDFLDHI